MKFRGKVWRHVPAGGYPAPLGYSLKAMGRWNRAGIYGCLYTALTRAGAVAEYEKFLKQAALNNASLGQRELVSLEVNIEHVADLTRRDNGFVDPNEAFLKGGTPEELELCRKLADVVRQMGFNAILSSSAALKGEKNLNIYFDGVAGEVKIAPGGDRILLSR